MYGLSQKSWELLLKLAIDPLKNHGAEVWIFGSRARGDYKKFSDIDILYELKQEQQTGFISLIKENLEESDLPIKVDLVDLKNLAKAYAVNVHKEKKRV
ncbi:MAG: nucleotidyltransferase domain-containing protein [Bdellovibrionota bacterium]